MVIFHDRIEAGKILAEKIFSIKSSLKDPIVLGVPRGGVPVGHIIAEKINAPLDTVALRKLPIPDNPEAGFGAVCMDKVTIFNEPLLSYLNLSGQAKDAIVRDVYKEVLRRNKAYRKDRPFPPLENRSVIITDDGLATGITMLAAVEFARRKKADEIIVAVPVAHRDAYELVKKNCDRIFALHISAESYFAVVSFYQKFTDMEDKEVVFYLDKYR